MSDSVIKAPALKSKALRATEDPWWAKALVLGVMLAFLGLVLFLPIVAVFFEALRKGFAPAFLARRRDW